MTDEQRARLARFKRLFRWTDDQLDVLCLGHAGGTFSAPRHEVCARLPEERLDAALDWLDGMEELARSAKANGQLGREEGR